MPILDWMSRSEDIVAAVVLTPPILAELKAELPGHEGPWVIYGEACRVPSARLKAAGITFKQTPYDVKAR